MCYTFSTLILRPVTSMTILKPLYAYLILCSFYLKVATLETRFLQIKSARRYIEKKTAKCGENDLVIFAGDFNANGPTNIQGAKSYKENLQGRVSGVISMFLNVFI
jgi:hypothetical protein